MSVKMNVYDLSEGMLSKLGGVSNGAGGIWHSGVIIDGKEYSYGLSGVQVTNVENSWPGPELLRDSVVLGECKRRPQEIQAFLEAAKGRFAPDKYHLTKNNCNAFTEEFCKYVCGSGLPSYISELPNQLKASPIGQSVEVFVDGLNDGMQTAARAKDGSKLVSTVGRMTAAAASGGVAQALQLSEEEAARKLQRLMKRMLNNTRTGQTLNGKMKGSYDGAKAAFWNAVRDRAFYLSKQRAMGGKPQDHLEDYYQALHEATRQIPRSNPFWTRVAERAY
uniref:PPPDE domain-containing protein n=1 Tax=Vitrella brassicaformis TaxID=1169539 RepID=A0A7S1JRT1_9ALVE|mmetsp:Transcript_19441/g.46976  ORF Transcript_19441/g.46976 Transcript_19441/m.46976 type:complete len:278 (+) Transcript_19441:125-958(+)